MSWTINTRKDVVVLQRNILALRSPSACTLQTESFFFLWMENKKTEKNDEGNSKTFKKLLLQFYFQLLMLTCIKHSQCSSTFCCAVLSKIYKDFIYNYRPICVLDFYFPMFSHIYLVLISKVLFILDQHCLQFKTRIMLNVLDFILPNLIQRVHFQKHFPVTLESSI